VSAYQLVRLLHILLAITAVGFNASYTFWILRAARHPEHLGHVLGGIRLIDNRIANPAYGLLLLSGLSMVLIGHLSFETFWIATALILYVLLIFLGLFLYSPVLRRQVAALEAKGADSPEYRREAGRSAVFGLLAMILVLGILFMMVVKPTF